MRSSSDSKKSALPLYVLILFLSMLIIFGIFEFRFLTNILNNYESNIEQIAINKTNSLFNEVKTVSENVARKIELQNAEFNEQTVRNVASHDSHITNVYLISKNGNIKSTLNEVINTMAISNLAFEVKQKKDRRIIVSELGYDEASNLNVIRTAVALDNGGVLVLDYRIDEYQKEIIEEFSTTDFKVAIFDVKNKPIVWPFTEEYLANFSPTEDKFYFKNEPYLIINNDANATQWQVLLFKKDTKFEQYRSITIILLVFALYYCLYQLLVELWGVNTAKSYFDNIDFAILNQINEGIIISNNAGTIVFANKAAHEIFSDRRHALVNVKLSKVMGHIDIFPTDKNDDQKFLLKTSESVWETIHSPIIKKGRRLGALSIIRINASEQKSYRHIFSTLLKTIPEGVIYVDADNIIVTANLMAKCYLGSLDQGKNIDTLDAALADAIHKNINTRSFSRFEIKPHSLWCDIAPVYDNDSAYIGSLIVLLNNNITEWE